MGDLRALHGKAALTSFDDSGNHEMDIEVLTQDTTRLFRKAEVRLQQFGQGGSTSEADEKVSSTLLLCLQGSDVPDMHHRCVQRQANLHV